MIVTLGDIDAIGRGGWVRSRSRADMIGHFLRTRRLRLSPDSVGLIAGPNRRGPGLRREEVALLANVSPSWYADLERGRRINASPEVLDGVADALRLSPAERRYLHELGSESGGPQRVDPAADELTTALVERLVRHTESLGHPAYAVNGSGDLLSWNSHMEQWYGEFPGNGLRYLNLLWWMFTSAEARRRIVNWEQEARSVTARARFAAGTGQVGPGFDTMAKELREISPQFAQWWDEHDVEDRTPHTRVFNHPELGLRTLQLLAVRPSAVPSTLIVLHLGPPS